MVEAIQETDQILCINDDCPDCARCELYRLMLAKVAMVKATPGSAVNLTFARFEWKNCDRFRSFY